MAFIRKIKASLVRIDIEDYVGESTYIFYDIVSGELRIFDGTPGGTPIFIAGDSNLEVQDEGGPLTTSAALLNFAGAGVTATVPGPAGEILVTIPGASDLEIEDEGGSLTTAASLINFAGAGVTATEPVSGEILVTIPGGSALEVEDEGNSISAAVTLIDFAGSGVTVTEPGPSGEMLVTIPSGGTVWGDVTGTLSDQTDLQDALDAKLEEEVFAQQIDFINDDLLYRGEAEPGTALNANAWRIRKITIDNDGEGDIATVWADGNNDFDNIWDNRLGLSYS